jgi:hypothetical protein
MRDSATWKVIKWTSVAGMVAATVIMLSPVAASTAVTPWILYLISNWVWCYDSYMWKNYPWMWLSIFFCAWDVLLVTSRLMDLSLITFLNPVIVLLDKLP